MSDRFHSILITYIHPAGRTVFMLSLVSITILVLVAPGSSAPFDDGVISPFAYVGRNSTSNDDPSQIAATTENIIFVCGTTSPLRRGEESDLQVSLTEGLQEEDFFMVKIDGDNHEVNWVYRDGTTKEDRLHAILLDSTGRNLFVAGRTFGQIGSTQRQGQAE